MSRVSICDFLVYPLLSMSFVAVFWHRGEEVEESKKNVFLHMHVCYKEEENHNTYKHQNELKHEVQGLFCYPTRPVSPEF